MLHKAWNNKGEMPYCFPRSSIKFQGHTVQNITDFDPNWAFPDYRPVAAFKSLRFALLLFLHKLWPAVLDKVIAYIVIKICHCIAIKIYFVLLRQRVNFTWLDLNFQGHLSRWTSEIEILPVLHEMTPVRTITYVIIFLIVDLSCRTSVIIIQPVRGAIFQNFYLSGTVGQSLRSSPALRKGSVN